MRPSPALQTAIRTCLIAQIRGDAALLATVARPDAELAVLLANPAPAAAQPELLAECERLQMWAQPLYDDLTLLTVHFRGTLRLLVAETLPDGQERLDLRWWIAASRPTSERDATARAFYAHLLTGRLDELQALCIDARGTELLAGNRPPAGEHGQLEHVAETMALRELAPGERYPSPNGVEAVDARHAKAGLTVLLGLTPEGLVPFLMKQVSGQWKVSPALFVMAVVKARGGTIRPA